MARDPQYGVTLNGWDGLSAALEANAQDFQELEAQRQQLVTRRTEVREAAAEQALHAAAKQDASQRLQQKLGDGRKLATFLRNAVRQRYGNRSEKLVEFGLQPLRSRRRSTQTEPDPPPTPTPE
jgi:hypothetical protein